MTVNQEGRSQTYTIQHVRYQDRRVSPNPCSVYHTPWWSLSEASEDAMHISWVKPTAIYSSCQVCGRRTAVVSVQLTTKYGIYSAKKVPGKNAGSEWFERQRLIDVWAGVEQSVIDNMSLLTTAQTSLCPDSSQCQCVTFWVLTVTQISQKVVSCNKLIVINLLLNKKFVSDYGQFSDRALRKVV